MSGLLISLAILGAAFVLVVGLQLYRHVLGIRFPFVESRLLAKAIDPPAGSEDLYRAAHTELSELGFEGPWWVTHRYTPEGSDPTSVQAVYRHQRKPITVWLAPPMSLDRPNALLTYVTTPLRAGGWAITQVSDPFFEILTNGWFPAQTVAPMGTAAVVAEHERFIHNGDAEPEPEPGRVSASALRRFAGEWRNELIRRLIEAGKLREAADGARPRWLFGLRALAKSLMRPTSPQQDLADPVPPARQALLTRIVEYARESTPTVAVQWQLFIATLIASVAVGAAVIGYRFTIILVGVIVFHEIGHWLAMRAFGYRNVHITLVPLLGGITMGYEQDPSAAKRAWVALAGPLPGIVLGWGMVALAVASAGSGDGLGLGFDGWLVPTAAALLFINYLNVLPVPPLDGAHVAHALLPPRWVAVQALGLLAGVAVGGAIGIALGLWIIAAIALLQLTRMPSLLRKARMARILRHDPVPEGVHRRIKLRHVLERLEQRQGPTAKPKHRIIQAEELLQLIESKPLTGIHRAAVAMLYVVLLVVPVGALGLAWDSGVLGIGSSVSAQVQWYEDTQERLRATAKRRPLKELISELHDEGTPIKPASLLSIERASRRIGRPIPDDLAAIYRHSDGLPTLGLASVDDITPLRERNELRAKMAQGAVNERYTLASPGLTKTTEVPVSNSRQWILLGGPSPTQDSYLVLDPGTESQDQTARVIDIQYGTGMVYTSALTWLRRQWVERRLSERMAERRERRMQAARERLAEADMGTLIDQIERPALWTRLITPELAWPDGATARALARLETRLGRALPTPHRRLLSLHNGVPPLSILPAGDIERLALGSDDTDDDLSYMLDNEFRPARKAKPTFELTRDELAECWVIGGTKRRQGEQAGMVAPRLLWCPEGKLADTPYVDLTRGRVWPSFRAWMLSRAVLATADSA